MVDQLCAELLREYLGEVGLNLRKVEEDGEGDEVEGRAALRRRWMQVKDMVEHAVGYVEV